MPYFVLFYEVVDDFPNKRTPFRADHLQHVQAALDRNELLMAGAFTEPADGALLIFRGADRAVAEDFAHVDPYVKSGLVKHWHVRDWNQVIALRADDDGPVRHT